MLLRQLKPNWMHIQSLKEKPFIHFNLETLGLTYDTL